MLLDGCGLTNGLYASARVVCGAMMNCQFARPCLLHEELVEAEVWLWQAQDRTVWFAPGVPTSPLWEQPAWTTPLNPGTEAARPPLLSCVRSALQKSVSMYGGI